MIGRVLLRLIGFYSRAISPALPPRCRFYPTCSAYAVEAISRHGAARGSWLALRRLVRCAPWHPGGVDLVPDARPHPGHGTGASGHSSSTPGPSQPAYAQPTPPAPHRAPQEESSVA
jgi:putative membrane protein insertion efficiency factor